MVQRSSFSVIDKNITHKAQGVTSSMYLTAIQCERAEIITIFLTRWPKAE